MKTWKDIKVGDTIYYIDHFKLHGQKVNSVNYTKKEFYGREISFMHITAGRRNSEMVIRLDWQGDENYCRTHYCTKYASKEAALEYLKRYTERLNNKVDSLKKKHDRFSRIADNYSKIIKENIGK